MLSSLSVCLSVLRALRVLSSVPNSKPLFFCFPTFLFYEFNGQLCHRAYWCTHSLAHMPILLFLLHSHLSSLWVCVFQLVYAFPNSSTFIYNYHHIHMCIHDDHSVMTTCNMNIPIKIRLCVPSWGDFCTLLTTCSGDSFSTFIRVYASFKYTNTMYIYTHVQFCQ